MEISDYSRGVQLWVPTFRLDSSAGVKLFLLKFCSSLKVGQHCWEAGQIFGLFSGEMLSLEEPPVPPVLHQHVLSFL